MWRKIVPLLLLMSTAGYAAPMPSDYPQTVHVFNCELLFNGPGNNAYAMRLWVTFNGAKYELQGEPLEATGQATMVLGDYKSRFMNTGYASNFLRFAVVQILLPSGKVVPFRVIGTSE
jgi:hypothetical protein